MENLESLLHRNGLKLTDFKAILDFGCGCGRIIRHLKTVGKVYGCDCNSEAIKWAKEHLPFAEFSRTHVTHPTAYSDNTFDLIFALSVLTHMPEELEYQWMSEFRRLLRPQGFLILSLHGDTYLERLTSKEKRRFLGGQIVVRGERHAGSNRCATFHPRHYVTENLAQGFHMVDFVPQGLQATQDLYLFQNLPEGAENLASVGMVS